MKSMSQSQIDVIKFLVCENEEVNRNKIVGEVDSVTNTPALRKIIDLNKKMCKFVTIRDMNENDQYKKQVQIGYTLNNDITTLNFLLKEVYPNETASSLMKSTYYQELIPDVIDYFNKELIKQGYDKLTSHEIVDIKDYLKCSESCLIFILGTNIYKSTFAMYQRLVNYEKIDTTFILDALLTIVADPQYNKSRRKTKTMIENEKTSIKNQYDLVYNKLTLPTSITGLFNHLAKTDLLKCHEGTNTANDIEKLLQKTMKRYTHLNKNAYVGIFNNGV